MRNSFWRLLLREIKLKSNNYLNLFRGVNKGKMPLKYFHGMITYMNLKLKERSKMLLTCSVVVIVKTFS